MEEKMANANEPGAAVQAILDQLIDRIKSRRPIRSDKKPAELGFVYSQLVLGMMVDPEDYKAPWSPAGGASIRDAIDKGHAPANTAPPPATNASAGGAPVGAGSSAPPAGAVAPAVGATAPGAGGAAPAVSVAPTGPDPKYLRAIDAAFKTSMLVDHLMMVTNDDTCLEYPGGGRKVSTACEGIVNGIQPLPPPLMAPEVQKRIDEARKVLYVPDDDGDLVIKSKLYKAYEKNARAYAQAVADYALAEAEASKTPANAQAWPMTSKAVRLAVDDAYDTLKTEGAEKIEAALDMIESVGVSIDQRLVAKARKNFDLWNLGLAGGVPVAVPYAYCSPTEWADPDADLDGWEHLTVKSNDYSQHTETDSRFFNSFKKDTSSSSTSASGGGCFCGFGAHGGSTTTSAHESDNTETGQSVSSLFKNTAKNLTIDLDYGIVDIIRPYCTTDLFYMKNWYLVGNKKHAISDGTIDGQAGGEDSLCPMLPMQFLVVRNVKISSEDWDSDGETMSQQFGETGGAWDKSSSNANAGASYGFGPFSIKGNVSHDQAKEGVSRYGKNTSAERQDHEGHFDGTTLTIPGAQIVAWLSTIVPACAPLDDPGLETQPVPAAPEALKIATPTAAVPAH
jgi:hypothetical protein